MKVIDDDDDSLLPKIVAMDIRYRAPSLGLATIASPSGTTRNRLQRVQAHQTCHKYPAKIFRRPFCRAVTRMEPIVAGFDASLFL